MENISYSSYNITWDHFNDHTKNYLIDILYEPDFHDVTLSCNDEKQISAHKVILSAGSEYFRKILMRNFHQRPLIIMDGIEHNELLAIIDFIYTGSADVPKEKLEQFMRIGTKLKIKGLEGKSEILNNEINLKDQDLNKASASEKIPDDINDSRNGIKKSLSETHENNLKNKELQDTNSSNQIVENNFSNQLTDKQTDIKVVKDKKNEEFDDYRQRVMNDIENLLRDDEHSALDDDEIQIMENVHASDIDMDNDIQIIDNEESDAKDSSTMKDEAYNKFEKAIEATTQKKCNEISREVQSNLSIKPSAQIKLKEKKDNFICTECGMVLPDHNNLQMHMFYKHKQKTYSCDECSYKAPRESKLNFHKKIIH